MRKLLLLLLCTTGAQFCGAQAPGVRIEKFVTPYAFPTGQVILDARKTPDGGYIAVGSDSAYGFNDTLLASKTAYADQWIVKTDSVGNVQWAYSPPRNTGTVDYLSSAYTSVILTSDGGILIFL